ncbi:MAG: hypothetical protein K9J12_00980 [Melioribacteraceae bacterium]|nr:hypothetical protein [Melioribacteraceae bacterium]MCF8264733.1 hypothetical protein [Melioribacteraceae bacterium]MCF8431929.1 hypothetical protein [Melioribacteraceae bacterium]
MKQNNPINRIDNSPALSLAHAAEEKGFIEKNKDLIRRFNKKKALELIGMVDLVHFHKSSPDNSENRLDCNLDEVINYTIDMSRHGISSVMLKCGENILLDIDVISYLIYSIKKHTETKIILSLGVNPCNNFKNWKIAGADGYLFMLNYESCEDQKVLIHNLKEEIVNEQLTCLSKLGFEVEIGFIVDNTPDYSEKLIKTINRFREIKPTAILPATPNIIESVDNISERFNSRIRYLTLLLRILFKNVDIYACEIVENIKKYKHEELLKLGANKLLVDFNRGSTYANIIKNYQ